MSDDLACWTCGTTASPDTRFPSLGYVRCPACDLVFAPASAHERLRELYGEAYFEDYGLEGGYDDDAAQRRREAQVRVRWVRAAGPPTGRLLEIGCASGWFLAEARAIGYDAVGIEPATEMAQAARDRSGAVVHAAMLEDAALEPASFDVAVAWHVLEHLARPREALAEVRAALRPGGALLLELPNIASLRAARQGEEWYGMEPAHHVAHYSPGALAALLRASGFVPEVVESVHPGTLLGGREAYGPRGIAFHARETVSARAWMRAAHPWKFDLLRAVARIPLGVLVRASFVVPSWNGLEVLREALRALAVQTVACEVVVVDNGSVDGTAEAVAAEFPDVVLVRVPENVGFGRAVNLGAARAGGDVLLVVNNDAVCAPDFAERMVAPFADPAVGMAAGVLTQRPHPDRVDSAGVELDVTVGSWDLGWNAPVASLGARGPAGPCGGAAGYRASAWDDAGGFDPALFAYWEDVDLALRLRRAGWACAFVPDALALHRHGATLGAATPLQRRLDAFGRGFVLGRHGRDGLLAALRVAVLDWPVLAFDLLVARQPAVVRERRRGRAAGRASRLGPPDASLLTVSFAEALRRRWAFVAHRLWRRRPAQQLE